MRCQLLAYFTSVRRIISNKLLVIARSYYGSENLKSDWVLCSLLLVALSIFATQSHASGVLPESSAVIIDEAQKGAALMLKIRKKFRCCCIPESSSYLTIPLLA